MPSEKDIERALRSSEATLKVEGLTPSPESKEIGIKFARGEISEKEMIEMVLKLHEVYIYKNRSK